jgi:uncharacterized damage-inducible protein DinB
MEVTEVRALWDFNYWARDRMLGAVEKLSEEQFRKDLGNSFPSIRDTLLHLMGAERRWLARFQGKPLPDAFRPEDFPTPQAVRARWAEVERDVRAYVNGLQSADVSRPFSYVSPQNQTITLPIWQTMQHVVNHGTYHRGQVITMLRQVGAAAVSTDLVTYYASTSGQAGG